MTLWGGGMAGREDHFEQDSMTVMKVISPRRRLIFLVGTHGLRVPTNNI
jgi:hypothetical protein